MKRLAAVTAAVLLALGLLAPAEAAGRHGGYGRHRPKPGIAAVWSAPGFALVFSSPGAWCPPPTYLRPPRKVWIPGYWAYAPEWAPGRFERIGRPGTLRRGHHRHPHRPPLRYGRHRYR